jgi:excisionase family DNA binding protein
MSRRTAQRPSALQTELVDDGETRLIQRRLLSPTEAAAYLGLQSRFAIYRLVTNGALPAVRLANKIRLDLRDLDAAIEEAKSGGMRRKVSVARGPIRPRAVPRELAPLRRRNRSVTASVTATSSIQ